jgi:hypothetical protein
MKLKELTIAEVVREECVKYDIDVTDKDIEYIVWSQTGYPCFWRDPDKTPEENFRMQLREWASGEKDRREKEDRWKTNAAKRGTRSRGQ